MSTRNNINIPLIAQEVVVGLTMSTVALSLGGAFGLLSGRGVLMGMLSAAIYPLVTSLIGGTRIQCSGPTGPVTTVFVAVTMGASQNIDLVPEALLPQYLNLTLFLTAVLLLLAGLCRLGDIVRHVPNVVISGFMNGVAFIIWMSQLTKLLQIGSPTIEGPMLVNWLVAVATLVICLAVSRLTKPLCSRIAGLLSGTLIALVTMTILCTMLDLPIGKATTDLSIHSWQEFSLFIGQHVPTNWPWHLTLLALPWALQLAGVAYLDTLLTSLIIDRERNEKSQRNKELGAQGIATGLIAMIGGVPGAQATARSVLMLKEGAATRLSGVLVGVFSLIGIFLLQDFVALIPKAVFAGILFKVGYDVFDWKPLALYIQQYIHRTPKRKHRIQHEEILIILLTTLVTVVVNIMVAVFVGTALFFILKRYGKQGLRDLHAIQETEGFRDEP